MNVKLIVFSMVFIAWVVILTQVLIPIVKRKPLFPMFGKRRRELEERIRTANEELEIQTLEKQTTEIESTLKVETNEQV